MLQSKQMPLKIEIITTYMILFHIPSEQLMFSCLILKNTANHTALEMMIPFDAPSQHQSMLFLESLSSVRTTPQARMHTHLPRKQHTAREYSWKGLKYIQLEMEAQFQGSPERCS